LQATVLACVFDEIFHPACYDVLHVLLVYTYGRSVHVRSFVAVVICIILLLSVVSLRWVNFVQLQSDR